MKTSEITKVRGGNLDKLIELYIGNTGNLMFMEGCRYACELGENEYAFYDWYAMHDDADQYKSKINEEFDLVIYPLANILQENTDFIYNVISLLEGITIPIYCMGIGLSWNKYETLSELCSRIKVPLKELINIVDKSGGKFACRGYMTQEVIERVWGKDSAGRVIATGCPSMYQNGLLHIDKTVVRREDFRVVLNGRVRDFRDALVQKAFREYRAEYIDQDEYRSVLYGERNINIKELIKKYSCLGVKLLSEKKIHFFYQLPAWFQWVDHNVDFMFGSRIHGNLIALLAGKPAMVYLPPRRTDLRVQELVDFFKIPSVNTKKRKDLYQLYQETDYSDFNSNFNVKFAEYEAFLQNAGILKELKKDKNAVLYTEQCDTEDLSIDNKKLQEEFQRLRWLQMEWYKFRERFY